MGSETDGTFVLENFYCRFGMELAEVEIALYCWSPPASTSGVLGLQAVLSHPAL